jgi:hypothetical protein
MHKMKEAMNFIRLAVVAVAVLLIGVSVMLYIGTGGH